MLACQPSRGQWYGLDSNLGEFETLVQVSRSIQPNWVPGKVPGKVNADHINVHASFICHIHLRAWKESFTSTYL